MNGQELQIIGEALFLPLYFYRDRKCCAFYPFNAGRYEPPAFYLNRALAGDFRIPFIATSYQSVYGQLPVESEPGCFLMIGPVAQLSYGPEDFHRIFSDYRVSPEERDDCVAFFQGIPSMLTEKFGSILRMIHFYLGNQSEPEFRFFKSFAPTAVMQGKVIEGTYESSYYARINESLVYEEILVDIVERGQVDKLDEITEDFFDFCKGVLADNPLRSMKNLIISSITLFTRGAIRGGVPSQLAFQISDLYINNLERTGTADEAAEQFMGAMAAFTAEVARIRQVPVRGGSYDGILRYVREHTDSPLSVAHIAAEFGYNSNYLSGAFKKELGFSLSSFILRTKLEKSRELLQYTNRSVLEISEHLCFSSQNYFQTVFRRQYGVTPLQYRKQKKKEQ